MKKKIWIVVFLLLILPFVSSSLLAAKFPIKKQGFSTNSQMGITAYVTVYANATMDIKIEYSNGNRQINKMYAVTYISLVDAQGNKIYSYKKQQQLGAVSCVLWVCGKTVTKQEATSVSLPANIASKVHDVNFLLVSNNDGPSLSKQMKGIEEVLLVIPLFF